MSFKYRFSFEKRRNEAHRILTKYPDRVPVICERDPRSLDIPEIDRKKYLIPYDLTVANFMYVIRKRLTLPPEKSIYLFVDETVMPATSQYLRNIYADHAHKDGFLYITYAGETTFG